MATLNAALTHAQQQHTVSYTGVRIRFQRSTDNGATWADVQSTIHALGTSSATYAIPDDTAGEYRIGAVLTVGTEVGTAVGTEVFSNVLNVALLATPTNVTLTVTI